MYSVNAQFRFYTRKNIWSRIKSPYSHTLWIWVARNRLMGTFGLYNCQIFPRQLCLSYKFWHTSSIVEISSFGWVRFFFYNIISVSKHTLPRSPELCTNRNWLYSFPHFIYTFIPLFFFLNFILTDCSVPQFLICSFIWFFYFILICSNTCTGICFVSLHREWE